MTQFLTTTGTFAAPGDIMLAHSRGIGGWMIKTGEALRDGPKAAKWTHAGLVVGNQGETIEAQSAGVVRANLADHKTFIVIPCPPGVARIKVLDAVLGMVGWKYSWLDLILMGVDCLFNTKLHTSKHTGNQVICSELVALCLVAGGWKSPKSPYAMMPSDLDKALT